MAESKTLNQTTPTNVIELPARHNKNFENQITEYAKANDLPMTSQVWQSALAAARRLDYTGNRDANPTMKLMSSQPTFLERVFGLFRRTPQRIHLSELDDIRAFLELAPEAAAQQSLIIWGPLRNGFGTWVIAILRPGGEQKGSRPTPPRLKDAAAWQLLSARRLLNGRALHVRGHLLHHGTGGAGVDFNLVILTAAGRGDFGANHANWVHRYLVEAQLLWAYRNMHGLEGTQTITEIYYEVVADYNRKPREGTEELRLIAEAYENAVESVRGKSVAEGGTGGAEPTHLAVMNELALHRPSTHSASATSPHFHDAMSAVGAEQGEDWHEVYKRIIKNQELWEFEDANVPLALQIRYSVVENGVRRGPFSETVSIVLPFSLAARFEA